MQASKNIFKAPFPNSEAKVDDDKGTLTFKCYPAMNLDPQVPLVKQAEQNDNQEEVSNQSDEEVPLFSANESIRDTDSPIPRVEMDYPANITMDSMTSSLTVPNREKRI